MCRLRLPLQGPVVVGAKLEDRLRIRRGLKAVVSAGMMRANTRSGQVHARTSCPVG